MKWIVNKVRMLSNVVKMSLGIHEKVFCFPNSAFVGFLPTACLLSCFSLSPPSFLFFVFCSYLLFFVCFFVFFWREISLCSSGWALTLSLAGVLELQTCSTTATDFSAVDCSFLLLSSSNKYTPFIQRGGCVAFVIRYCFVPFEKGLIRIPLPKITVTAPRGPVLVAPALPPLVFKHFACHYRLSRLPYEPC